MSSICIVTQSIGPIGNTDSDSILFSQCVALAESGHRVTILLTDDKIAEIPGFFNWVKFYSQLHIELINLKKYHIPLEGGILRNNSFRVYQWLKSKNFEQVYFEDKQGVAFYSLLAKSQELHFVETALSIYSLGPIAYLKQNEKKLINSVMDLEVDFLERKTFQMAHEIITFDHHLKDWLEKNNWTTKKSITLIEENSCSPVATAKFETQTLDLGENGPLISICIPHFERPQLLQQLLESLQTQTYKNFEVIVVDDGTSNIENIAKLKELEQTHLSLINGKLIYSDHQGPSAARNKAVHYAQGKYLLFMDDDNIASSNELEIFLKAALTTNAEILTCLFQRFYSQDRPQTNSEPHSIFLPLGGAAQLGLFDNVFGDMNCLILKDTFLQLGGLQGGIDSIWEDWELFSRAALSDIQIEVIPEVLFWYREQTQSQLKKNTTYESFFERSKPYYEVFPPVLRSLIPLIFSDSSNKVQNQTETENDLFLIPVYQLDMTPHCIKFTHDIIEKKFEDNALTLLTKAPDPHFAFSYTSFQELQKAIIQIEVTAPENTYIELFYKTNDDIEFTQEKSILTPISKGWNIKHISISAPSLNGEFRVDTGNISGTFIVHSIKIFTPSSIKEIETMKRTLHDLEEASAIQFNSQTSDQKKPFANNRLLKLAVIFEKQKWEAVNNGFKRMYRTLITKFFEKLMRFKFKENKITIRSRHSTVDGSKFNLFLSDLDWDIVLPENKLTAAHEISNWLGSSKKVFPFLGEQEYYLDSEFELKTMLLEKVEPYYSILRTIRKVSWMEKNYLDSQTPYHKYKSLRAMQICFAKLNIQAAARPYGNYKILSHWLENYVLSHFAHVQIEEHFINDLRNSKIYSQYLCNNIKFTYFAANENEYSLSPRAAVILLSICPESDFKNTLLNEVLFKVREQNLQIKNLCAHLREIEILITQSAARNYKENPEWAFKAFEYLSE